MRVMRVSSRKRNLAKVCFFALCLAVAGLGTAGMVLGTLAAAPMSGGFGMPTGGYLSTYFLQPIDYEEGGAYYDQSNNFQYASYAFHHGIDVSAGCVAGSYPVYAAASGTIALAQYINDGYGSQVAIDHGYNLGNNGMYTYTFYSHMGSRSTGAQYILVSPGQRVEAGQIIGYQGNDGAVYGSCNPDPGTHLDWEVRVNSNPLSYDTSMRYNSTAASPDFYTNQQLTYTDPSPASHVVPGPFSPDPGPQPTWTPGPCGMRFVDIPDNYWAYPYISYLYCRGIVSGYDDGTFRPADLNTRGQFAKMIVLGFGWQLYNPYFQSFTDVPPGSTFYQYIETAHLRNIISGYEDGTFRPGNSVTRAQASKMLVLSLGQSPSYPPQPTFWDVPPGYWGYGYIEEASNLGVISGYNDGSFRPDVPVMRAQLSKMLALAMQRQSR